MHKTSRNRPGPFRHTRRNAADQLHAQNEPESPRPLPPQTPERGGPTPCTKRAGIAPSLPPQTPERGNLTGWPTKMESPRPRSATHAGTRRTNSMHKTSRNRPVPFRHTRRNAADQLHAQNGSRSNSIEPESPPFRHTRRNAADQLHAQNEPESPRPQLRHIAPAPSRHKRRNAADQLHAQNKPESPRPLPPHTPERGGPTPCTKRAGIAPAPSATHAGTRRTNSMHKT